MKLLASAVDKASRAGGILPCEFQSQPPGVRSIKLARSDEATRHKSAISVVLMYLCVVGMVNVSQLELGTENLERERDNRKETALARFRFI
jgi:hypothetical protein